MNFAPLAAGSTRAGARPLLIAVGVAAIPSAVIAAALSVAAGAAGVPALPQLTPPAVALFAGLGSAAAVIGWNAVRGRTSNPRALLTRLVPLLLLLSFVPDVLLGVSTARDTGLAPVLTLAAMHVTTVVITVAVCLRALPLPRTSAALPTTDTAARAARLEG